MLLNDSLYNEGMYNGVKIHVSADTCFKQWQPRTVSADTFIRQYIDQKKAYDVLLVVIIRVPSSLKAILLRDGVMIMDAGLSLVASEDTGSLLIAQYLPGVSAAALPELEATQLYTDILAEEV